MSNNINVLAIDFNVIMYHCIRIYKNYIESTDKNISAAQLWNRMKFDLGLDKNNLSYDSDLLKKIVNMLKNIIKNNSETKLIAFNEQKDIVKYFKKNYDNKKVNLINIDFFNDFCSAENAEFEFDKYTDLNWIGYLNYKNKLETYTWIKMCNSDNPEINIEIPYKIANKRDMNNIVDKVKIDLAFLSCSPLYVPYEYYHMYEIIVDLLVKEE